MIKIITIVGARPQFIKVAAVSRVLKNATDIEEKIIHTGQHFDENMSSVFFGELNIPTPAYNLEIHGGNHGQMTAHMLEQIEKILLREKPDLVLIYGDTNSTLAGALAAAKLHIPIAHVEAGLRSFNRAMPEEINRIIADHMSELLFCSTKTSIANLNNEGIKKGVFHVGDVMYDATLHVKRTSLINSKILDELKLTPKQYNVCTLHRAENTDSLEQLEKLISYIDNMSENCPTVFPVHPRTRAVLQRENLTSKNIIMIDPVGYIDMNKLLESTNTVFTDSGGLQKEAYFHRAPCVTLRNETEWVETIEAGWNRLWQEPDYAQPRQKITDYGEGNASQLIVEEIRKYFL